MNKVILMGRLTREPDVRYSAGENATAIARYFLAVDRRFKRDGEQSADFISCVSFGKAAEFAEKYLHQGTKIAITGRIQTGSYTNREGQKVYTTDVVVEECEFAESKNASGNNGGQQDDGYSNRSDSGNSGRSSRSQNNSNGYGATDPAGFMNIPDGIDEELPFN